jgi:hypothetical protein
MRPGEIAAVISRLLPAARVYVETRNGTVEPMGGRGRRIWVVSRSLCRFYSVALLPGAPRAGQLEALALEIKRFSPFDETGSHFHLGVGFAGIWLWDARATRTAADAVGLDISKLRVLPEPALVAPGDDEVRLVASADGVEAQRWSGRSLTASRWWADLPDDRSWLLFQRGASVPPDQVLLSVPSPIRMPWLQTAWTSTRGTPSFDLSQIDLRMAVAATAAFIIVAYGYVGAEWLHAAVSAGAVANEVAERAQAIEPILTARTRALENLSAIRTLRGLERFPSQLALMAAVAEALPHDKTKLTAWTFDRGQLEIDIAAPKPLDVVELVRSLERLDHFKSVAAERTGSGNTLRLRVAIEPL